MMGTRQEPNQIMNPIVNQAAINSEQCNQLTSHTQQQQTTQQPQQKSQLLPILLSPRPPGLRPESVSATETDHDQIIEQVISLENEYSENLGAVNNVDNNTVLMMNQPLQNHQIGDINLTGASFITENNQLSSSSEDLFNLLLELDKEPSNLIGMNSQQMNQDDKVGIENIRKQLISCEVQSETNNQGATNIAPTVNQISYQASTQAHHNIHQQQSTQNQQMLQAPLVITHHHQNQAQLSNPGIARQSHQHHRLSVNHPILQDSYSNTTASTVPVSSSGQSYTPQQQQQQSHLHHQSSTQSLNRISQTSTMSIVNDSPSPSWQPQLSPYSPQPPSSNSRTPVQEASQPHTTLQHQILNQPQHRTTTTSPQMQQILPMHRGSLNQPLSPPASTEPSPVVKKNPLLNAQLVNSRAPSITPPRFIHANVLDQNPILNAKLSHNPFVTNSANTVGSPSMNQPQFIQQSPPSNFGFDITQHQPQNAQQQAPPQAGHLPLHNATDQQQQQQQQQQQANPTFRGSSITSGFNTGGPMLNMGDANPAGGFSQQVRQEIRRKVQQPKQQTTSLLKKLLSDDVHNK